MTIVSFVSGYEVLGFVGALFVLLHVGAAVEQSRHNQRAEEHQRTIASRSKPQGWLASDAERFPNSRRHP